MKNLTFYNGFWFTEGTNKNVMNAISSNLHGKRLRFWFGDSKTGKSWNEENDICGYIGRSTGLYKVPLLLSNKRSYCGGEILANCVVKIIEIKTNRVLYQHSTFNQSVFSVDASTNPGYESVVLSDDTVHTSCKTYEQAVRLADFMNGKRHNK